MKMDQSQLLGQKTGAMLKVTIPKDRPVTDGFEEVNVRHHQGKTYMTSTKEFRNSKGTIVKYETDFKEVEYVL